MSENEQNFVYVKFYEHQNLPKKIFEESLTIKYFISFPCWFMYKNFPHIFSAPTNDRCSLPSSANKIQNRNLTRLTRIIIHKTPLLHIRPDSTHNHSHILWLTRDYSFSNFFCMFFSCFTKFPSLQEKWKIENFSCPLYDPL